MSFLLINKPIGWTSHDVVAYIRKQANCHPEFISRYRETLEQVQHDKRLRVGHAGTLDPFAAGLLIVGIGRESTKKLDEFKKLPKTYVATIKLGEISDTYDNTGHITRNTFHATSNNETKKQCNNVISIAKVPAKKIILSVIKSFIGRQLQTPPMFSAKKVNGKKLYELARQGKEIKRRPAEIEIYKIKLLDYSWPYLQIEARCSTGTYIRSLANDIGEKLGVGAYCCALTRIAIGEYKLSTAQDIKKLPRRKQWGTRLSFRT